MVQEGVGEEDARGAEVEALVPDDEFEGDAEARQIAAETLDEEECILGRWTIPAERTTAVAQTAA